MHTPAPRGLPSTPSQTVGPFLHIGLPWQDGPLVVAEGTPGAVWVRGTVYDGAGEPVPDALVETWQADPQGRLPHPEGPRDRAGEPLDRAGESRGQQEDRQAAVPAFRGFGRCATDSAGAYGILTQPPGAVDDLQAPHIDVSVFARGLLHRVVTRIYFPENADANAADPVLARVPRKRATTVLAERAADGYRFDVRLQGEGETVFFDV